MKQKALIGLFTLAFAFTAIGCSNAEESGTSGDNNTDLQKEVQDLKLENSQLKAENEKLKKKIELLQKSK